MMRTGFIGLGAMGAPMARRLHQAGLLTAVWNRTGARAAALAAELGCQAPATAAALTSACDTIVICVSADQDVQQMLDTIRPALRPGQLVIDCSTISADTARAVAVELAALGVQFLDAPVTGGVEGAQQGSLAILVGGDAPTVARAMPVLQAMGTTITHFGPHGAGQAAKATNQIICAGVNRANAEALAFAAAQGLDLNTVISTLSRGAAGNWYLQKRGPNMAAGSFPAGFRVRLHAKDLRICQAMAQRAGVKLPVIEETLGDYAVLIDEGHGEEDISAIYRLKHALFDKASGG